MATFKHSGDLGDIIYSLPAIRALGGGTLYLDLNGGRSEPLVQQTCIDGHTKLGQRAFDSIRPLLLEQPYVSDVLPWAGQPVDHNLDGFRRHVMTGGAVNLVAAHLRAFGLDESTYNDPWLSLRSPPVRPAKPIVISRTVRYHSKYRWWMLNIRQLAPRAVFVGFEKEHDIFQYTFECQVDFHPADNALEVARVLAGAECLIGNSSFTMTLAHGLGTAYVQELYDYSPCVFQRANGRYMQ